MKPELWTQTGLYDLYKPTLEPDRLVLFAHGWLGNGTVEHDVVERAVGDLNIALAVLKQTPFSRPRTFHEAIKDVTQALEIDEVEVINHSIAQLVFIAKLAHHNKKGGTPYNITKMTAVDAVGTSDKPITHKAVLEGFNMIADRDSRRVAAKSVINFARNPIGELYEATRALTVRGLDRLDRVCEESGAELHYVFHDNDNVVRTPSDRRVSQLESRGSSVVELNGGHLETTGKPETIRYALRAA